MAMFSTLPPTPPPLPLQISMGVAINVQRAILILCMMTCYEKTDHLPKCCRGSDNHRIENVDIQPKKIFGQEMETPFLGLPSQQI